MFHFDTPVPPHLSVELHAGTVAVETSTTAETSVELVALDDSDATRAAIATANVEQHGDDIHVHLRDRSRSFIGRGSRVAVRIGAPDEAGLRVRSGSADITALGTFATTTIDTGSGNTDIGTIIDALRVSSGSGDVNAERVDGDATVKTGSGDVVLGAVGGEVSFSSGSGDLRVGTVGRAVGAKTGSGDVTVGAAPPDVRVTTASGDVRIDATEAGELNVRTASGDIRAGVRAGTAAWLDVRSVTGRVTSGLESAGAPTSSDPIVRVQLSTVSGDVELRRI